MEQIKRVGVDTSKHIFTVHGVDEKDRPVLRRNLRRSAFLEFFAKLAPTKIAMEACAASHHWGRELQALGHQVVLIPPQYVKPFVKRGKNDRNDAEAISEAAARPGMANVAVKSAEQQANAMLLSVRELLSRQRTQLVNALRGHAAEFGLVAAKGDKGVTELLAAAQASLPTPAVEALTLLGRQIEHVEAELAQADLKLQAQHRALPASRLLETIPGVGWMTALTLTLRIDASQFESGRHLAAWLGLVPKENSTGGKHRLGAISRAGDERLRSLLVLGATAVIRHAKPGKTSPWLLSLLARKPRKLAAVALANKLARVVWAVMTSGESYRPPQAA
ncbi:MAG TPA: IS110 family transposase [Xanthobacteraceae bacterium]|nr:IS110 family transposase [Xanthobacteraceae bacterium]